MSKQEIIITEIAGHKLAVPERTHLSVRGNHNKSWSSPTVTGCLFCRDIISIGEVYIYLDTQDAACLGCVAFEPVEN